MTWDPTQYLQFDDQRTRAAADLAARIQLDQPQNRHRPNDQRLRIVDLGCGPGNSTQVLRRRWPDADIVGIDRSPEMIASAASRYPDQTWRVADLSTWDTSLVDLLFANAALHWIPDHLELVPRLLASLAPRGVLAFQIPSSTFPLVRTHIHAISKQPRWTKRMEPARNALTMHPPGRYYDALVSNASKIDIWETEYQHALPHHAAIIEWFSSAGLRPFLEALESDDQREAFLDELNARVVKSYPRRVDGKVLFPFRRTFVIAYR